MFNEYVEFCFWKIVFLELMIWNWFLRFFEIKVVYNMFEFLEE